MAAFIFDLLSAEHSKSITGLPFDCWKVSQFNSFSPAPTKRILKVLTWREVSCPPCGGPFPSAVRGTSGSWASSWSPRRSCPSPPCTQRSRRWSRRWSDTPPPSWERRPIVVKGNGEEMDRQECWKCRSTLFKTYFMSQDYFIVVRCVFLLSILNLV